MSIPVASPPLDEVTTALLDLFEQSGRTRAAGRGFDGVYGGDPVKPPSDYWILYQIAGGNSDPFPDLDLDLSAVEATWQLTSVSKFRNQAQRLQRVCRDLVFARSGGDWTYPIVAPTGWQIVYRRPDPVPAGVDRAGDVPTAVFSAPFRFTLTLCPA